MANAVANLNVTGNGTGTITISGTPSTSGGVAFDVQATDSVGGVSIIEQLKEGGLHMGLESYVVPFGRDTASVVYVLNFAIRAALTFGGIKAGNTAACVDYVRNRVPAFVLLLGGVDEIKAAAGGGALAAGVPIITDLDLPEIKVPGVCAHEECLVVEKDHKKIVQKAIETRGIKVKVSQIPVPVPVPALTVMARL